MAMVNKVAEVFVEFLSKDGALKRGLGAVIGMVDNVKKAFTGLAAAQISSQTKVAQNVNTITKASTLTAGKAALGLAADLYNFARQLAQWADKTAEELTRIQAIAVATGKTVGELTRMNAALGLANTGFETFARLQQRWNAETGPMLRGTSEISFALRMIGVSAKGADGNVRNLRDVLVEAADKLKDYSTESRLLLSHRIFGETSPEFLALMAQGGDAIKEREDQAVFHGLGTSGASARAGTAITESFTLLWEELKRAMQELVVFIGPVLVPVIRFIAGALRLLTLVLGFLNSILMGPITTLLTKLINVTIGFWGFLKNFLPQAVRNVLDGIMGGTFDPWGPSKGADGKMLSQTERILLGQGGTGGPMSASFMGFGELGRQALLSAIPPTGVADRMLVELKSQTALLQTIAGMSAPVGGMNP